MTRKYATLPLIIANSAIAYSAVAPVLKNERKLLSPCYLGFLTTPQQLLADTHTIQRRIDRHKLLLETVKYGSLATLLYSSVFLSTPSWVLGLALTALSSTHTSSTISKALTGTSCGFSISTTGLFESVLSMGSLAYNVFVPTELLAKSLLVAAQFAFAPAVTLLQTQRFEEVKKTLFEDHWIPLASVLTSFSFQSLLWHVKDIISIWRKRWNVLQSLKQYQLGFTRRTYKKPFVSLHTEDVPTDFLEQTMKRYQSEKQRGSFSPPTSVEPDSSGNTQIQEMPATSSEFPYAILMKAWGQIERDLGEEGLRGELMEPIGPGNHWMEIHAKQFTLFSLGTTARGYRLKRSGTRAEVRVNFFLKKREKENWEINTRFFKVSILAAGHDTVTTFNEDPVSWQGNRPVHKQIVDTYDEKGREENMQFEMAMGDGSLISGKERLKRWEYNRDWTKYRVTEVRVESTTEAKAMEEVSLQGGTSYPHKIVEWVPMQKT